MIRVNQCVFADCVDIALRHVINLLTYSSNYKSWDLILHDANIDKLSEKLKKVFDVINSKGEEQFYDLKTRLQMFFLY